MTFYKSTQLNAARSAQEVKGQQMGRYKHLAFSGQVSVTAGGIYCKSRRWVQVAIALQNRDHYGSELTSVWIEFYRMVVFGSVDTVQLIVKEVYGRCGKCLPHI